MKKVSFVLLAVVTLFAACSTPFKKTKDGVEYKIISEKGGKILATGNIMELDVLVKYKDSVIFSSVENGMPQFAVYDTAQFPPTYKEIFKTLHVGDSVVIKTSVDSLIKLGQADTTYMKKGGFVLQTYKVKNTYATQEEADKSRDAAMKGAEVIMKRKEAEQLAKDDKIITDYLKKNNITAVKAPLGTYVQIINPGTGNNIDTTVVVKTNYTGRTIDGKMFDSNTDPSKGHVQPFNVNMTSDQQLGGVIKGWTDGMNLLKKGSVAKFFIPSSLAYGKQGAGQDIKPDAVLIFDIEVLDLITKQQALAEMDTMRKEMEAKQKQYMDSVSKANPNAGGVPQQAPGN